MRQSQRTQRGFTLIELLVVMSIIAALAAMILPAIGAVRASALAGNCKSNLRQVYGAHLAYANDWKGLLPPTAHSNPQMPWIQLVSPFLDKTENKNLSTVGPDSTHAISPVTSCVALRHKIPNLLTAAQYAMGRGYCRNSMLEATSTGTVVTWGRSDWGNNSLFAFKLSSITFPSQRLLLGDGLSNTGWSGQGFEPGFSRGVTTNTANGLGWFYKHLWINIPGIDIGGDSSGTPWTSGYLKSDFHRGKRSYLMCDGSARNLTDDYQDPRNQVWLSITAPGTL